MNQSIDQNFRRQILPTAFITMNDANILHLFERELDAPLLLFLLSDPQNKNYDHKCIRLEIRRFIIIHLPLLTSCNERHRVRNFISFYYY